jgi:hypothetical protein
MTVAKIMVRMPFGVKLAVVFVNLCLMPPEHANAQLVYCSLYAEGWLTPDGFPCTPMGPPMGAPQIGPPPIGGGVPQMAPPPMMPQPPIGGYVPPMGGGMPPMGYPPMGAPPMNGGMGPVNPPMTGGGMAPSQPPLGRQEKPRRSF